MAHTIELGTKHFEPVLVEVEQLATGNTISFIFKDYLDSVTSPYLYTKAPSGITNKLSGTALSSPSGAAFEPSVGTFMEEGLHAGTIEWTGPDGGTYSFPIAFRSYKNTAARKVTKSAEERTLYMNESYSVALGGSTFGGEVFALISDGAYTVAEGAPVLLPDSVNGPLELDYDSSNTGAEITVTNIGASPYMIPEITFFAYKPVGLGYSPMTEALQEMTIVSVNSEKKDGAAILYSSDTFTTLPLPVVPERPVSLIGFTWDALGQTWNESLIYSFPNDGTQKSVISHNYKGAYDPATRTVTITATGNCTSLNFEKIGIRSGYYEEA